MKHEASQVPRSTPKSKKIDTTASPLGGFPHPFDFESSVLILVMLNIIPNFPRKTRRPVQRLIQDAESMQAGSCEGFHLPPPPRSGSCTPQFHTSSATTEGLESRPFSTRHSHPRSRNPCHAICWYVNGIPERAEEKYSQEVHKLPCRILVRSSFLLHHTLSFLEAG